MTSAKAHSTGHRGREPRGHGSRKQTGGGHGAQGRAARGHGAGRHGAQHHTVRWIVVGALVVGVIAAIQWLPVGDWIEGAKSWIDGLGWAGPLVFVAGYVVMALLLLPASAFTVAAGSLFGLGLGLLWASIGANLTAIIAFLVARHLARGALEKKLRGNERFEALDDAIGEGTWKVVLLLRLSPIVPFGFSNYAMGLTQVRFAPYCLATLLGMLPGTFVYVYAGWIGAESLHGGPGSAGQWILLGVGLAASVALTWWLARVARAKLSGGAKTARKAKSHR
jgi:uncharacterized membrane protein YdjX (TVP38/TMEM64 family)